MKRNGRARNGVEAKRRRARIARRLRVSRMRRLCEMEERVLRAMFRGIDPDVLRAVADALAASNPFAPNVQEAFEAWSYPGEQIADIYDRIGLAPKGAV